MELPKPIYEILPVIYLITAATTVTLGETTIRFLPVVLFCLVALMIRELCMTM